MNIADDTILTEREPEGNRNPPSTAGTQPVADSAMATGTDDEPEMTIADKHIADTLPDPDGNGKLTSRKAATLLGDTSNDSQ